MKQKIIKKVSFVPMFFLFFALFLISSTPLIAYSDSYDYELKFKINSVTITTPQKVTVEYTVDGGVFTPVKKEDITFILEKKDSGELGAIIADRRDVPLNKTYSIEIDPVKENLAVGEYWLYGLVGTRADPKSDVASIPVNIKTNSASFSLSCEFNKNTELIKALFSVPESDKNKKIKVVASSKSGNDTKNIIGELILGAGVFSYHNDATTLSDGAYDCKIYSDNALKKTSEFTISRTGGGGGSNQGGQQTGISVSINFPCPSWVDGCGESQDTIPGYISRLYLFGIGISGILGVGMIVAGGILYSLSAGNPQKQGEAKDMISSALWGILLLFGAYLILKTVNPRLVMLSEPEAEQLKLQGYSGGGAQSCDGCVPLDSSIPSKPPGPGPSSATACDATQCIVHSDVNELLKNLVKYYNPSKWQVTEAYPPTTTHLDSCHNNGRCVDIALKITPSCDNVQEFINAAIKAGFKVTNEYYNCPNTSPKPKKFSTTTGGHLHVSY